MSSDQFTEVDGLRIRYREAGAGPTVLLLHGSVLGSSLDVWERSMGQLANDRLRVIAYDQPGYGRSDDPDDLSARFRRDFIPRFMDAVGIDCAGLVGHSNAGNIVVQIALMQPQRVAKLIVLATGSLLPPPVPEPIWNLGRVLLDRWSALRAGARTPRELSEPSEPSRERILAILRDQLYDHSLITPELVELRYEMAVGHRPRRAESSVVQPGAAMSPVWKRIGELKVPMLMLYGRNDLGLIEWRARLLRGAHPSIEIRVLDRCKHLVQIDRTDAFIEAATAFFSQPVN